ncbi:hypothetical protein C5S35_07695 [Candidatus Methanophagaceae archaeon]|nr:hypothetical protein C5S35_07695 [Methanophagales archaeon]
MEVIGELIIASKSGATGSKPQNSVNKDITVLSVNKVPTPLQIQAIRTIIAAIVSDVLSSNSRLNVEAGVNNVPEIASSRSVNYSEPFFFAYSALIA